MRMDLECRTIMAIYGIKGSCQIWGNFDQTTCVIKASYWFVARQDSIVSFLLQRYFHEAMRSSSARMHSGRLTPTTGWDQSPPSPSPPLSPSPSPSPPSSSPPSPSLWSQSSAPRWHQSKNYVCPKTSGTIDFTEFLLALHITSAGGDYFSTLREQTTIFTWPTISRCLLLMIRKRWREAAMGVPYVRRRWQWNHWPKWNESVRWLWWSRLHDDDDDWWLISILYLFYIQGGWGRVQDAWVRWWRKSRGNLYKDGQVIIKSTITIWIDIGYRNGNRRTTVIIEMHAACSV